MAKRIVIIEGHPDPSAERYGHALADAYAEGALQAGHEVERIAVADLDFPLLRSQTQFEHESPSPTIQRCQELIKRADHLVILYPLWLGTMPALLKGFLEQVLRPGFAYQMGSSGRRWRRQLAGKTARVVVTMGMPALVYRWIFGAHSLKSLKRNILGFVGIRPVRDSLIGMVAATTTAKRERWLVRMRALGQRAG